MFAAEEYEKKVLARLGATLPDQHMDRAEREPLRLDALEKIGMAVLLLTIVFVAVFNIVSALIMVVMEKRREIGVLKSMGPPPPR